jgi:hypothetical protein
MNTDKKQIINDNLDIHPTLDDFEELERLGNSPLELFWLNIKTDWYFFTQTGIAAKIKMMFNQFLYLIGLKKEWVTEKDYPEIKWDITK